jgi:DNA polymerase-1
VTGDHDTLQLVDGRTRVFANVRGMSDIRIYDEEAIKERYGLRPNQLIDYKAMRGDASDNLPGLKGIGEKRATELLQKYDSIEGIYEAVRKSPEDFKPGVLTSLQEGEKELPLSKKMVTIIRDLKLPFSFKDTKMEEPDMAALSRIFQDLGFKGLHARVMRQFGKESEEKPLKTVKKKEPAFELFKRAERFAERFKDAKAFAFRFGYASEDRIRPKFRALAAFDGKTSGVVMLSDNGIPEAIAKLFSDTKTVKIGHDVKDDMTALKDSGAEMRGETKDIMLMSYLLTPGSRSHDLASLVFEETGKKYEVQDSLFPEESAKAYVEEAKFIWKSCASLEKELEEEKLTAVYEDIDMPLVPILSSMERHGIRLDVDFLAGMETRFEKEIARVTKRIH